MGLLALVMAACAEGVGGPPPISPAPTAAATPNPVGDHVTSVVQQATKDGEITFNPPASLQINHSVTVAARVGSSLPALLADYPQGQGGAPQPQSEQLLVAPEMMLTLAGSGFNIAADSPSGFQFIPSTGFGQWLWTITATEGGEQDLDLTASVMLGGGLPNEVVPTFIWHVTVRVSALGTIGGWFGANWLGAITGLGVVFGWVGWLLSRRRSAPSKGRHRDHRKKPA